MDGVMFMHSKRLADMRKALDAGAVGPAGPRAVHSAFTFRGDEQFFRDNIRIKSAGDPLGCLGDLGWYNVRLSLWAYHYQMPYEVRTPLPIRTPARVLGASPAPVAQPHSQQWAP